MKTLRVLVSVLLSVFMTIGIAPMNISAENGTTFDSLGITDQDAVIIYTNDVHGGISDNIRLTGSSNSLGYAGLAGVRQDAIEHASSVLTVDIGDAIQGSTFDTLSDGEDSLKLMNECGYDVLVPGNHEFDYGIDTFFSYLKTYTKLNYVCCNFTDMEGNNLFDKAYDIKEMSANGKTFKVAFVGVNTPESIAKGTPRYYQDEDGEYIYTFNADTNEQFYDIIQKSVDEAKALSDFVVIIGHLGDQGSTKGWGSREVIENTNNVDLFIDGHAHTLLPEDIVQNKDGKDVILTSAGCKLDNIGIVQLNVEGDEIVAKSTTINTITDEEKESDAYKKMDQMVKDVEEEYAYLAEVVGNTDFGLMIYDPVDESTRLVRNRECNMGNLLTDGFVWYSNNDERFEPADCALLNGGSIRANIDEGEITYTSVLNVFPWYTHIVEIKAPGQVIVDALEMGVRLEPEECGGFMTGSGINYSIDLTKESKVVCDEHSAFVKVDGSYEDGDYRVFDVVVNGEPIDLEKEYNLVLTDYYYQDCGDGMTMFKDCEPIVKGDDNVIDVELMCMYFKEGLEENVSEKYQNPYGEGRLQIYSDVDTKVEDGVLTYNVLVGQKNNDDMYHFNVDVDGVVKEMTVADEQGTLNLKEQAEEVQKEIEDAQDTKSNSSTGWIIAIVVIAVVIIYKKKNDKK